MPRKSTKAQSTAKQPALLGRAALYLRVSTEDQANEGYGLDVQRARGTAQIIAKGWQLAREYVDAGISGTVDASERPGLAALLADIEAGQTDAVVVLALDRLGRKTMLVLSLVETFNAAGITLVSCKESLDTSTPTGQFVLTMFAGLAQLERDTIVERTKAGRDARGMIDGEKGGSVPYGYVRSAEGEISIDQHAMKTVRFIFSLRSAGNAMGKIADVLNLHEVPTTRGGAKWYASSVREILLNEADYRGGKRGASSVRWPKAM
jgi:site-specific DNA recombinase